MTDAPAPTGSAPGPAADRWRCPTCGAWLAWNPARKALACASCSGTVPGDSAGPVTSHPFAVGALPAGTPGHDVELGCRGCGARIPLAAPTIAGRCTYCAAPVVATAETGASPLPDAVVAATVDLHGAQEAVARWVASRRLAPTAFKKGAAAPRVTLAYHPLWVFDASTTSTYDGERGEDYTVTVWDTVTDSDGSTSQVAREETETRWYPASGTVARDFTDVAEPAGPHTRTDGSWDLSAAESYADDFLVGATATAATVPLTDGWSAATGTMRRTIESDACADIGGDHQRVSSVQTAYAATLYRYLLAPSWSGDYQWKGRLFTIEVNAETGTVSGDRPWSRVKIALLVALGLALIAAVIVLAVLHHPHPAGSGASTGALLAAWGRTPRRRDRSGRADPYSVAAASTSSGMSKLDQTFWTSSWSSSASSSRSTRRASPTSATGTVWLATMASSADSGFMSAASSASRTAPRSWAAQVTVHRSPSSARSSAPASTAISMIWSSSSVRASSMSPFRSNCQATAPGSAIDPPFLEKMFRTSAPVRFRLSDSVSTMMATPAGA